MSQTLMEVARFLEASQDAVRIEKLQEISNRGLMYMAVFGHYSAGKSMLINNLVEKSILPVKTNESTAVLTYVQYGQQECVRIFYANGYVEERNLSAIQQIFQNSPEFHVESIDHLEVFVTAPLLEQGLILVDTPGVNTVISRHMALTAEALEQSHKMLYVLGGALTAVDRDFLEHGRKMGLDILLVRTKCDRFQENEEASQETLAQEKGLLCQLLQTDALFFPVSNLKESEYFRGIEALSRQLQKDSRQIGAEIAKSCDDQMEVYRQAYRAQLTEKMETINLALQGKQQELEQAVQAKTYVIKRLEHHLEGQEKKLESSLTSKERDALMQGRQIVDNHVEQLKRRLKTIEDVEQGAQWAKSHCQNCTAQMVSQCQNMVQGYLDGILEEVCTTQLSELPGQELSIVSYQRAASQVSHSMAIYQSQLQNIKAGLVETKTALSQLSQSEAELQMQYDSQAYDSAIEALEYEIQSIPNHIEMIAVDHQGVKPSQVLRNIGAAVDVALLLLPGDAIVAGITGAVNTTKVAQALHKGEQIGEAVLNAGKTISESANVIDGVRDTAMVINGITKKRKWSSKEEKAQAKKLVDGVAQAAGNQYDAFRQQDRSSNIFDMLSVAYWSEKLGKEFDAPPRMEVDVAAEQAKAQRRATLKAEQQKLEQAKFAQQKNLGLMKTQYDEQRFREKSLEIMEQNIGRQMAQEEEIIAQKAKATAIESWVVQYGQYVQYTVMPYIKELIETQFHQARGNIAMYIAQEHQSLVEEISDEKAQIEGLLQNGETQGLEAVLQQCKTHLESLQVEART